MPIKNISEEIKNLSQLLDLIIQNGTALAGTQQNQMLQKSMNISGQEQNMFINQDTIKILQSKIEQIQNSIQNSINEDFHEFKGQNYEYHSQQINLTF